MIEEWRDIGGFEGFYEVSNLGRVRSLPRVVTGKNNTPRTLSGKTLKNKYNKGYSVVNLSKDGVVKTFQVHRLVALAFLEKVDGCNTVNHKDINPKNNVSTNLEWGTQSHNMNHDALFNSKTRRSNNSGERNVYFENQSQRWKVVLNINRKRIYVGSYKTKEKAVEARNMKKQELRKEYQK